jgi:hypothetical protein
MSALRRRWTVPVPASWQRSPGIYVARRRIRTLLQAGVSQPVHDHVIVASHQRLDDAVARRPSGRIKHGMLELQKFGDRSLQTERVFGVARQRRRAGAMHAVLFDDGLGDVLDLWIGRQTQIVLGGEIQSGKPQAAVVAGRTQRQRRLLGGLGVRPQAAAAPQRLPIIEAFDPRHQIDAAQFAKIAHAAGKRADGVAARNNEACGRCRVHLFIAPRRAVHCGRNCYRF